MIRWWSIGYWAWWWQQNKSVLPQWALEQAKVAVKKPEFWLTLAAYAIPLCFLLYVLYINFLPFGYSATYTINVGAPGDTDSSKAFYLEPSPNLSDASTTPDGKTFRTLNGTANVVFNPGVVLKNAKVTVSVESDPPGSVQIIPPTIDFDPNSVQWDYSWDFSTSTPHDLVGDAFHFDNYEYFDGKSKLELPNSADMFESGPFTVYAEWTPTDSNDDFQEIVGHYNWELLQNRDSVSFQVGRMNSAQGQFYSIKYPITADFFNKKHSIVAVYSPSDNGHIELYVDGRWVNRTYFGTNIIWPDYNTNWNLSLGKAGHGAAQYFKGSIYRISYLKQENNFSAATYKFSTLLDHATKITLVEGMNINIKKIHISIGDD